MHERRVIGSSDDVQTRARRIFDALRAFDDTDVREIWAQCPDDKGLGLAVANRLKKPQASMSSMSFKGRRL